MVFLKIIGTVGAIYLVFYGTFWLVHTLFGLKPMRRPEPFMYDLNHEVLILLPAYRPGPIFFRVMDQVETLAKGKPIRVYVLLQEAGDVFRSYAEQKGFYVEQKSFASLPGNSYQHALRHMATVVSREWDRKWSPEFVMLLDKDNLVSPSFFDSIAPRTYTQFDIIQGRREPLAATTPVAFFDSVSETLNDVMFRQAKANLGMATEISGSGALIEAELFIDTIDRLDPLAPGFDKNFMVQLLTQQREVRTTFHPTSTVKEEKTSDWKAHGPQRTRWFGEQYYNALYQAPKMLRAAWRFRRLAALDYLVTLWRPPRSVQVVATPALAGVELVFWGLTGQWLLGAPLFCIAFVLTYMAVFIFLLSNNLLLKALRFSTHLPHLAWQSLMSAARSVRKENQGKFIHTTHEL